MRYATLRELGLPIGSGATESAARTLIGKRAKGSSRSWVEPRLRGVLTLRALRQSDRLSRFWSRFARRCTATVEAAGSERSPHPRKESKRDSVGVFIAAEMLSIWGERRAALKEEPHEDIHPYAARARAVSPSPPSWPPSAPARSVRRTPTTI